MKVVRALGSTASGVALSTLIIAKMDNMVYS